MKSSLQRLVVAVLVLSVSIASLHQAFPAYHAPFQSGNGWLRTSGSDIVDSLGQPVILRGANWMETVWGAILNEPLTRRLDEMKSYGANMIRLSLNSALWLGVNVTSEKQANYTTTIDWIVDNASQRGMYVLLDFHNDLFPDTSNYRCERIHYDMANSTGYNGVLSFWQSVASRYANNPAVLYEIWGQPQHCPKYLDNAGNQTLWWKVAYNLTTAIQSTNPNALVFVPGLSSIWELKPGMQELWYTTPLPLNNIVYTFHRYYANDIGWNDYANAYSNGDRDGGLRQMTLLYEFTYFQMVDRGYPMFVSETGAQITQPLWDVQFTDEMELLASHNVGFSYWAWWRGGNYSSYTMRGTFGLVKADLQPVNQYRTMWVNVTLSPTGLIWAQYLNRPYVQQSGTITATVYSTVTRTESRTATVTTTQSTTTTESQLVAEGYPSALSGIAVDSSLRVVYVTAPNLNKLFVLSGATNSILATIQVGSWPSGVACNPSTGRVYVANLLDNNVSVIDANTNSVISTVAVGSDPQAIAVNPRTNMIYVVNTGSSTVSVMSGTNNAVIATIAYAASGPTSIAVNPSTNLVYVASVSSALILVINGTSNKIATSINADVQVSSLAVNPSSNTIFVASSHKNLVKSVSASTKAVLATVSTVPFGALPSGIAVNPTSGKVFVSLFGSKCLLIIDGSTSSVQTSVDVGDGPLGVAVDTGNNLVYVANWADATVSVINPATNSVVAVISLAS